MTNNINDKLEKFLRPEVRTAKAYGVVDPGDLIKLDAMENPFPWPDDIKSDWLNRLQHVDINRYPDPAARNLKTRLREAMAIPENQELLLGNGSDEIIQMVLLALALPNAVVMAPTPTFVMYEMTARFCGLAFVGVPLKPDDFELDMDAMLAAIEQHQPAVIFLAYPNNPTANLFSRGNIETILRKTDGLVVVDEAYHAFAGATYMDQLGKFDNLLVMRTVSKLGLAGLRLGLLAGPVEWLSEFDKVRLPYNINSLTQISAEFALEHRQFLDEQTAGIQSERKRLGESLLRLPGVDVWPSDANFILFRMQALEADRVFNGLRSAGILVKNLDKADNMLQGCLRVTVGTRQENDAFIAAMESILKT